MKLDNHGIDLSLQVLGEKNLKWESGGRKWIYFDATDFQPTAQQVKLGLNLLSLLLIYGKYIDEVGKPSRRFFPLGFWAEKNRNGNLEDENRHIVMRPITDILVYRHRETRIRRSEIVPKEFSLRLSSPVRVQVSQEYSNSDSTTERKTCIFVLLHKYL